MVKLTVTLINTLKAIL